jgi:glycosyltransferase involved in cell wall biosynthesis
MNFTLRKLSFLIPAYNEERTIRQVLDTLRNLSLYQGVQKQLIVVNDCSSDNTEGEVQAFIQDFPEIEVLYFKHATNMGKGGAIKTAIKVATGDYVIVQDADNEYDPEDINKILKKIIEEEALVVYGSRILKQRAQTTTAFFKGKHPDAYLGHYLGGVLVTVFTNIFGGARLTDEPTCYKCFQTELVKSFEIIENDFAWEPEITIKVLRKKIKIHEVPISYFPRSMDEGKKISWKDGVKALWTVVKYRLKS